jgi:hypothetical protein
MIFSFKKKQIYFYKDHSFVFFEGKKYKEMVEKMHSCLKRTQDVNVIPFQERKISVFVLLFFFSFFLFFSEKNSQTKK